MTLALFSILALAAPSLPSVDQGLKTGERAPADAAVVIGLEDYAFIADVPYAKRDATAFYEFLVYTRGVPADRVRLLTAGGREQILGAVASASSSVAPGGTLWVYFAGHGAANPSTGERILLGDDVRQDPAAFAARAIAFSELRKAAGASKLALLTDTCYSGLGRSGEPIVEGKRFAVPVAATAPKAAHLEWTAAAGDQLSGPLHPAEHGAFTYFMIGALRGWADGQISGTKDGTVTAEEASLYVQSALRSVQINDQTPELSVSAPGEWVLSRGAVEPAPVLTPALPASPPPSTGYLAASNLGATTAALQAIVDQCAAINRSAAFPDIQWYIQFRVKNGVQKMIMVNPIAPIVGTSETVPVGTADPSVYAQYTCIRQQIKALAFTRESPITVVRTLSAQSLQ